MGYSLVIPAWTIKKGEAGQEGLSCLTNKGGEKKTTLFACQYLNKQANIINNLQ